MYDLGECRNVKSKEKVEERWVSFFYIFFYSRLIIIYNFLIVQVSDYLFTRELNFISSLSRMEMVYNYN